MIKDAIKKIVEKKDLNFDEAQAAMDEIMGGSVSPVLIASFLVGLRLKGETIDEIAGAARSMRNAATTIAHNEKKVFDTCGTGGDGSGTFNISTATAFVVAGAGYTVAKHGNKSVSSRCGSADVLTELGVNIQIPPEKVSACLNEVGIAFLFAPLLHGAMKYAMPVRKELGIRTIFNLLGPLTNPAGASAQMIGVYHESLVETIARVLKRLGTKHAMVVHGQGLDEISTTGISHVCMVEDDAIKKIIIDPQQFGIPRATKEDLSGGDQHQNARHILDILSGKKGKRRDITVLNSAAAILIASKDAGDGRAKKLSDAFKIAVDSIDSGAAFEKLEKLIGFTNK